MKNRDILERLKPIEINLKAKRLVEAALIADSPIRPCYYMGSSKGTTVIDLTNEVRYILDTLKLSYVFTNDAKRGGRIGNKITITY